MDQYVKDAYEVVATFGITPVKDGNAWCVLLGPNLQEGICGFGDTPHEAIMAFYREFRIPAKKNPDENITVKKNPIPVEWTDEEKKKLDRIYQILGWAMDEHAFSSTKRLIGDKEGVELQDFLRSIAKPIHWKPSEEQMEALNALRRCYASENVFEAVNSLYHDLQKQM